MSNELFMVMIDWEFSCSHMSGDIEHTDNCNDTRNYAVFASSPQAAAARVNDTRRISGCTLPPVYRVASLERRDDPLELSSEETSEGNEQDANVLQLLFDVDNAVDVTII